MSPVLKILLSSLLLAGCAGNSLPQPPLRLAAENANRIAVEATNAGRWKDAESSWLEALNTYQSMDDWPGQGRARLGLAQTYARLAQDDKAYKAIEGMSEQPLFPVLLRARAAYQEALLLLREAPSAANEKLDHARSLCGEACDMASRLDNLEARIAAGFGLWGRAQLLAARALAESGEHVTEKAHAQRLLAEAAMSRRQFSVARDYLYLSIENDRLMAEPEWLLEDYRLLEQVARESADNGLAQEAKFRQGVICAAIESVKCTEFAKRQP